MRTLNVILALSFVAVLGTANSASAQRLSVGTRLGVAISDFGGDFGDLAETDSRTAFTMSGVFGWNFSRLFAFQPEIAYVLKGATDDIPNDIADVTLDLRYLELQLPLVLTIPIAESGFRPRLYSGPAVALELSCEVEVDDGVFTVITDCDERFDTEFGFQVAFTETKALDIGWLFGGGFDLAAGPGALTGDLRYNVGLTDINDFPGDFGEEMSIKNRALQLLLGYVLYFGGPR